MQVAGAKTSEERLNLQSGFSIFTKTVSRLPCAAPPASSVTMIVVHGGPAVCDHSELFPHLPQMLLDRCPAVDKLVFYDQLGAGRSDKPDDASRYSLAAYVDELEEVLRWACPSPTSRAVVLGYSWGGQILLEFLFQKKKTAEDIQLVGAIISNTPLDEKSYEKKQQDLRGALDDVTRQFLEEEESTCDSLAYSTLIGQSETRITGEMATWSALPRLMDLRGVPILFVCGENDTVPHEEYESIVLERARAVVVPDAGHAPFYEKAAKELYFNEIVVFIDACLESTSSG